MRRRVLGRSYDYVRFVLGLKWAVLRWGFHPAARALHVGDYVGVEVIVIVAALGDFQAAVFALVYSGEVTSVLTNDFFDLHTKYLVFRRRYLR